MRTILFDGQYARHIGKAHVRLILQPCTQKIQIFPLRLQIVLVLSKQAVPFIDQDDEGALRCSIDVPHDLHKVVFVPEPYLFMRIKQIQGHILFEHIQHFVNAAGGAQEFLNIDCKDIVLVQVLFVGISLANLHFVEKDGCIFFAAIICRKHIRGHGLAKATRATDAHITLLGVDQLVDFFDQSTLVHINLRIYIHSKLPTGRIQIIAQLVHLHTADIADQHNYPILFYLKSGQISSVLQKEQSAVWKI